MLTILLLTQQSLLFYNLMESIQQVFKIKCIKGNEGKQVCAKTGCKTAAIMCQTNECDCKKTHENCFFTIKLKQLSQGFQKKGKNIIPILKQIYQWYNKQVKLISIQMDALKRMIDQKDVILTGKDKQLYHLFQKGWTEDIIGNSVYTFLDSIQQNISIAIQQKIQQTKEELKGEKTKFDGIIEGVKKLVQASSLPTILGITLKEAKFAMDLCSASISIINQHTIKLTNYRSSFLAAFLTPYFFRNYYISYRVKYKINHITNNNLMFGVCQITTHFSVGSQNIHNQIQFGSFNHCGSVYLGKSSGHSRENSNITYFFDNDIIEVEYISQTQRVTVKNITRNTQSVSYIKTDDRLPIYFVVLLNSLNDSVSLVDIKYQN